MNLNLNRKHIIPSLLLLGIQFGCSHTPPVHDLPETTDPKAEIQSLDKDMAAAHDAQVDVLSPNNYSDAQRVTGDAHKSIEKQKDAKDILHEIAIARAYLNQANEAAKLSHNNIEEVIAARQQAITALAPGLLTSDFKDADNNLKKATSDMEGNDPGRALKDRKDLQAQYLDLELRAIKKAKLGEAEFVLKQAKKEDAEKLAPRSYMIAEKNLKDSDAFITGNRHDTDKINARSAETLASAKHSLKIARDVKNGRKESSEDMALQFEGVEKKVLTKEEQVAAQAALLASQQAQLSAEAGKTQNLQSEVQTQQSKIAADKAFNEKFEAARAMFSPSEAEVYRQGNALLIRLKGLNFPTSKAVITGSNFALLGKLEKVIADFGKSSVTIEGHTDSIGKKATNEKLSEDRAAAVKEYLVTQNRMEEVKLNSVGYGDEKPLASNKTSSGRAQNRRVDVRIEPTAQF